MPEHADDEHIQIRYSSSQNISFRGTLTLDTTWGDWREMNGNEQDALLSEAATRLIDITVVGE